MGEGSPQALALPSQNAPGLRLLQVTHIPQIHDLTLPRNYKNFSPAPTTCHSGNESVLNTSEWGHLTFGTPHSAVCLLLFWLHIVPACHVTHRARPRGLCAHPSLQPGLPASELPCQPGILIPPHPRPAHPTERPTSPPCRTPGRRRTHQASGFSPAWVSAVSPFSMAAHALPRKLPKAPALPAHPLKTSKRLQGHSRKVHPPQPGSQSPWGCKSHPAPHGSPRGPPGTVPGHHW